MSDTKEAPVMRCKMIFNSAVEGRYAYNQSQPLEDRLVKCQFGVVIAGSSASAEEKAAENAVFGASTPSGSIELNIVKRVADRLIAGKAYYVDFTAAD